MRLRRVVEAAPVLLVVTWVVLAAGCTTDGGVRVSPTVGVSAGTATPEVSLTPVDPGPPPVVTVPPPVAGEVARVVVTRQGPGKAFRNVPGVPVAAGRTYTV